MGLYKTLLAASLALSTNLINALANPITGVADSPTPYDSAGFNLTNLNLTTAQIVSLFLNTLHSHAPEYEEHLSGSNFNADSDNIILNFGNLTVTYN